MTRAEFVRRWARGEAAMADDLTALLDAERATAREEQRKADALAIYGPAVAEVAARVEALEAFGAKVNAIRDSIVGAQALNWSEHAYPLVAALDAAGFSGKPYPEARANVGTLLERLATAERERDEAREESRESAASDMDSLQRLRAVEPALERARVERDDAERARDEWKARAESAEAELATQREAWLARVASTRDALTKLLARHRHVCEALLACVDDPEVHRLLEDLGAQSP